VGGHVVTKTVASALQAPAKPAPPYRSPWADDFCCSLAREEHTCTCAVVTVCPAHGRHCHGTHD
jgi:hypothetical protein